MFCKNWVYLHAFGIVATILIILVVFLIPESPKYYYANKRFDETRKIFK